MIQFKQEEYIEPSESHRDTKSRGTAKTIQGFRTCLFILGNILGFTTELPLDQILISVTDRVGILVELVPI